MKQFNGMELLELLAESEENVAQLYFDLSEKMKDEKARNIFRNLGNDESSHKNMYRNMMHDLDHDLEIQLDDEDYEYVESLIHYNVFRNEAVKKRYAKEDALVLAEKIERDTLLLAREMQEMFPDVATEQMNNVLKTEKRHLHFVLQSLQNQMYKNLML